MTHDYLTALPHRAVLSVSGQDARSFLQRVLTHGPEGVTPDQAMLSALLTPQGKVLADLIIFDDGDGGLFFDLPKSEAEALLKRFKLYRLRADAVLELREDLSVIAASGESEAELRTVALAASPDPRGAGIGWRAIAQAGGPASDLDAYQVARIKAGAPEMGMDFGPAEVFSTDVNHDLLEGIDYKKGCFVGQEVASRMHRKGGVRKRTVRLTTTPPVQPGDPVLVGETSIGAVSSAAPDGALARVRVDRLKAGLDEGMAMSAGGAPATLIDDLGAL